MAVLLTVDSHVGVLVPEGPEGGRSNSKEAIVLAVDSLFGVLVAASKGVAGDCTLTFAVSFSDPDSEAQPSGFEVREDCHADRDTL